MKLGVCQPTTSLPSAATTVCDGKPNHEASRCRQVFQRRCVVASVAPPSTEVIGPTVLSSSQERAVPKMSARKTAMRLMNPLNATAATMVKSHRRQRDPLVLGPVDAGDDRGQVEADQHDDGTGDDRRQHLVQHRRAEEVDRHADERSTRPATRIAPVTSAESPPLGADRGDATDERGRGAEVARHLALHDEQERDGRDAAHHDGELRVEPHDEREDEGRAEHRDDVLGAEADGLAPREPLVRRHDVVGPERCRSLQLPTKPRAMVCATFLSGRAARDATPS